MLERILRRTKRFFREQIEKVAENIYWGKYKKDAISHYCGGFSVSTEAQQSLDYIIKWAGKKDPIERFLGALREIIGCEVPVCIQKMQVCEDNVATFKILISLFEVGKVFLELNEEESIIAMQHNHCLERKLVYTTYSWNRNSYEYETIGGTYIKCGKYEMKIVGVLNDDEKCNVSVSAIKGCAGKCLYLQVKEMAETIEDALDQILVEKVCSIYKVIKESISSACNVDGCTISISALGVSAKFVYEEVIEYKQEDKMVSITPYRHWLQKIFRAENGAEVIFENKQFKILNAELEEVGSILEKAKEAFDKIESLDF